MARTKQSAIKSKKPKPAINPLIFQIPRMTATSSSQSNSKAPREEDKENKPAPSPKAQTQALLEATKKTSAGSSKAPRKYLASKGPIKSKVVDENNAPVFVPALWPPRKTAPAVSYKSVPTTPLRKSPRLIK